VEAYIALAQIYASRCDARPGFIDHPDGDAMLDELDRLWSRLPKDDQDAAEREIMRKQGIVGAASA
jgi:hypothetical protein